MPGAILKYLPKIFPYKTLATMEEFAELQFRYFIDTQKTANNERANHFVSANNDVMRNPIINHEDRLGNQAFERGLHYQTVQCEPSFQYAFPYDPAQWGPQRKIIIPSFDAPDMTMESAANCYAYVCNRAPGLQPGTIVRIDPMNVSGILF